MQIINDILDLSKIEAEKLTIDPVAFRLRDGWSTARPSVVSAEEKGLEPTMSVRPTTCQTRSSMIRRDCIRS
jgi:hypothetical protein